MSSLSKLYRLFFKRKLDNQPLSFKERFAALRYLPKFLRLAWETSPTKTLLGIVLRTIHSLQPITLLYFIKLIIDEITRLVQTTGEKDYRHLIFLAVFQVGTLILFDIISRCIQLVDTLLGELFSIKTSIDVIAHTARLDLDQLEDPTIQDKMDRAKRQMYSRASLLPLFLSQLQDSITLIFLIIGVVTFNPWLIAILLLAIVPIFLGESYFSAKMYTMLFNRAEENRQMDYLKYTGSHIDTAKELKVFGVAGFIEENYKKIAYKFYDQTRSFQLRKTFWTVVLTIIGTLIYFGAFFIMVADTIAGKISLGTLVFLSGSFEHIRTLLQGIVNKFAQVASEVLYIKDFFDFLGLNPKITSNAIGRPFPQAIQQGFVFENVGFKYQSNEKWVIRNLNFELAKGEKLALVGENGAGKTTIVKLLSRLYDPSEGRILLDGYDIREYDTVQYRQAVGIIFQDFIRFQMTVKDNIAIGKINERHDLSKIKNAAAKALATSLIQKLPEGFNQVLGKTFSKGVDLSGGEWQKIALSRAYMRDAQLLILDEPTSAIDAKAEHEVFKRFSEMTESRTSILISHRFSTVRIADRILVLEGGQIIEIGSHDELLNQNGKYSELFLLQAQGYM